MSQELVPFDELAHLPTSPYNWKAAYEKEPVLHEEALSKCTVVGGGSFGCAMASVAARKGARAFVWVRDPEFAARCNETRKNEKYLPEFTLEESIHFTSDIKEACRDTQIVLLAIPTPFLREFIENNRSSFPVGVPILLAAKGIEVGSLENPYQIVTSELPGKYQRYIGCLAGPSFAKEILEGKPTNVCVASEDPQIAFTAVKLMSSKKAMFRVYATHDVMGTEVGGAVKNVLAIASGCAHGLNLGNNARAGMLCRGLAEMRRLALALGSSGVFISGLAGTGDLFMTCSSELSRNFRVGMRIAKGEKIDVSSSNSAGSGATATAGIAEGILTAKSIHELSQKLKIHMPISEVVFCVLYEQMPLKEAMQRLMDRPLTIE